MRHISEFIMPSQITSNYQSANVKNGSMCFIKNSNNNYLNLTKREIEIIQWIACGKSSKEIARVLNISPRTVETHLSNVKNKLNCCKVVQIIYLLTKLGTLK